MELIFWTLSLLCIGLISLPWSVWWGGKLAATGTLLSPWWGILAITLMSWMVGHSGMLPLTPLTLWGILSVWAGCNLIIMKKSPAVARTLSTNLRQLSLIQLSILIPFCIAVLVRGFNPAIDNFEKFMDMNFMHASYQATTLPVQDTWFVGRSINYYYFGHYTIATLTKLSGVRPAIGYNFGVATVFAISSALAYTIGASLIRRLLPDTKKSFAAGVITSLLVTLGGTLYTATFLQVPNEERFYWFYRAIRLIPSAIHEMPGYSIAVADLHAHLLNVPVVLLMIIVTLVLFEQLQDVQASTAPRIRLHAIVAGVVLGIAFMTSAWDVPMYAGLLGWSILVALRLHTRPLLQTLRWCAEIGSCVVIGWVPTIAWFWINFDRSIAQGIGRVHAHTSLLHLATLWGPHLFVALLLGIVHWKTRRFTSVWWYFTATLFLWGCTILLVPEFIYIKDIYGADLHRLNTILKFYYQAYIILGIVLAVGFVSLWEIIKHQLRWIMRGYLLLVLTPLLCFPLQIVPEYYGNFTQWRGLDGQAFLRTTLPNDAQAIEWITTHTPASAVIVEAAGDSYSEYARISTFTGRSTIIGWHVHEWLWRGSYDLVSARAKDVEQIYTTSSAAQRQELIEKYAVSYIYIGELEQRKYPTLATDALKSIGDVIWQHGDVTLIAVHKSIP